MDIKFTRNGLGEYRCGVCLSHSPFPSNVYERISPYIVRCRLCRAIGVCVGKHIEQIAWKENWSLVEYLMERGMQWPDIIIP